MLSDLVQAGTKALGGARFSLVNILPGALLAAIVVAATRSGAYGLGEVSVQKVIPSASEFSAGTAVVSVFALFVFGVLLLPFQIALVQLLEGYWGQGILGRTLGGLAVERHRRRYTTASVLRITKAPEPPGHTFAQIAKLARDQAAAARRKSRAEALLKQFPLDPDLLMPTMLGNVLRNGEDYAGSRYGLDALTVYPRMYPSLSKPLSDAMTRQLDLIAVTAGMCVSFVMAAAATAPLVRRVDEWSAVPVVALLLGVLAYRGALRAASDHVTLFATAFDLHRFDMLRTLHYELPKTVEAEHKFNAALTKFLQSRLPPHGAALAEYEYEHPQPEPSQVIAPGAAQDGDGAKDAGAGDVPSVSVNEERPAAEKSGEPDLPDQSH